MNLQTFNLKLRNAPRPVVVDLWAPWCGPCKMVKPILETLAGEYKGRVDLWQINADENADLLRSLKVYGIPTLIVFRDGKEMQRYTGAKPASALKALFETLAKGEAPAVAMLSVRDRVFRLGIALALAVVGLNPQPNWILLVLAGIVAFTAVYDRCPIWKAVTTQFKKMTGAGS